MESLAQLRAPVARSHKDEEGGAGEGPEKSAELPGAAHEAERLVELIVGEFAVGEVEVEADGSEATEGDDLEGETCYQEILAGSVHARGGGSGGDSTPCTLQCEGDDVANDEEEGVSLWLEAGC